MNNAFEEVQITKTKILDKLQIQLKDFVSKGVKVNSDSSDPLVLVISVPERLAFEINSDVVSSKGVAFLSSFIPKLMDTIFLPEFRADISSVVIEGHTDSLGPDEINLRLSQSRSMEVIRRCIKTLESDINSTSNGNDKKEYFLRILSASGRGKQDLVMNDNGQEDHAKSRRVVFKIRVRSFEEKKIEKRLVSDQ
jgi:chemotaxis protein MotB